MEERKETWTKGPWEIAPGAEPSVFARVEIGGKSARMFVCSLETTEVDEWPEQRDANARLIAAAPALYEALSGVEFIFARPGESSVDRFERLAEAFYRDTGLLAPGKDAPAAGGQPDDDVRRERYDAWIDARLSAARSALLLANTGGTENG